MPRHHPGIALNRSQEYSILIRQNFLKKKSRHDINLSSCRKEAGFAVCAQMKIRKTVS